MRFDVICLGARSATETAVEPLRGRRSVAVGRRNFMVPVPSCRSFADLNARLEAACRADLDRRVRGKPVTKAEAGSGRP